MTDKTSTARIQLPTEVTGKTLGRSAVEWRTDFLSTWALGVIGSQTSGHVADVVKVGKTEKPRFEIHERETAKREYRAVLIERRPGKANLEVAAVRIGMFGKLLDKPVKQEVAA